MAKQIIQFAILFVVLVASQVLVFNHLYLFNTALPIAFIYFIMRLPVGMSYIAVMTLSFIIGLTVDIFSDTPGMNALACTILAVSRIPMLRLYVPREEDLTDPEPSSRSLGLSVFMKYDITVALFYCSIYFIIESFTFFYPGKLIARIVGSTLFTFIVILSIDTLLDSRREKRL